MTALGRPLLRPGSVVVLLACAATLLDVGAATTSSDLVVLLGYALLGATAGYSLSGSI